MIIGGIIAGFVISSLFLSMLTQQPPQMQEEEETSLLEFTSEPR